MQRQNILSQIEEDISKFHEILSTEKNKLVLEEKVLDILGEIETKVSQIIGDKNGRNVLQKEEVFQRYLSLNHIESQYRSIDDFLDELIVKLSQELNQRKIKLKFDLFERGNSQIDGSGIAKEKIEIKTSQKNKIFLRVLHKMGIDFADVKQFEETLAPERMRKVPYQIYHITTGNIQKTVLISDQIGQATFVYDTIISPAIFQVVEKGEEIEGHNALKIIYNKKSYERNLEIALSHKLTFEEKEVQIVNEVEEKSDEGKIQKATKTQLQEMWKKGELTKEYLGNKWKDFSGKWNAENAQTKQFSLPTSIYGLIGILGGDTKISFSSDYIISLLEGKEFVNIPSANKTQLQEMWKKGEFTKENFGSKWKKFADAWNTKNSQTRNVTLPISLIGIIGVLGGDINMSKSGDYIISLLEGKEFVNIPSANKTQLQEMWKKGEFTKENFGSKWKKFADAWNAKNAQTKQFNLPTSLDGMIGILGGDKKISQSSDYIISLLEGKEFVNIPITTKFQLQEIWKKGELTKEYLGNKWKEFAESWNAENAQTKQFTLPTSINGLIGILGGDKKISFSSDYIISLLEGKEFVNIPSANKTQLQEMWKKGEFTKEYLGNKWKEFAESWNVKHSQTKKYTLPISLAGLIGILGGDTKISMSTDYIISLLEGKEFVDISREIKIGLQEMWKNGELTKEDLGRKWKEFAESWNVKHSQTKKYTLPISLAGLIGILGGDTKISMSTDYIISFLEGKEWNQKKQS